MILYSCGKCHEEQGETFLDIKNNGKGASARKTSMGEVQADVDDRTHVSFPVLGNMDDEKYLKEFVFVPVVQSPGIAFIALANQVSRTEVVALTWKRSLPIVLLIVVMGLVVALLIWIAVSIYFREVTKKKNRALKKLGYGILSKFGLVFFVICIHFTPKRVTVAVVQNSNITLLLVYKLSHFSSK